jgi:hypothetical protein
MFRKSVFIMLFVCLMATACSAVNIPADWWIYQLEWNGSAGDANWYNPANWNLQGSGPIPDGPDANNRTCVLPNQPGPRIDGNAKSYILDMNPWDPTPWGWNDVNVTVTSTAGDINMGSVIRINSAVDYDSYLGNPILVSRAILNVFGGTVTTPGPYIDQTGMCGIHIGGGGSNFAMAYGMLNIYGGEVNVPRLELHYGEIGLYGGTLRLAKTPDSNFAADGNFVFSTTHPEASLNKIKINGGTLIMDGNYLTSDSNLPKLIAGGYIVCERGTLGTPVFTIGIGGEPNRTTLTADVNYNTWRPVPANNATNIHTYISGDGNSVTLSWSESIIENPEDVNHDVYFGTSQTAVANAIKTSPEYKGTRYDEKGVDVNADPCSWTIIDPNFTTIPGTIYYWRVDETNSLNVNKKGAVWKFTSHDGKAYNPKPIGNAGLKLPLQLSWTAGDWAVTHKVYFTTEVSGGNLANIAFPRPTDYRYRGEQAGTTYSLMSLLGSFTIVPGTTYYWCVDEVNSTSTWKGPLWSFVPTDYVNIDDFEDSMSTVDVNANWPAPYTPTGQVCIDNTSIGIAGRILMRDSSGKYLNYHYDNANSAESGTGMTFSEAKRPYPGGLSFSGGGIFNFPLKALNIDHRGDLTNSAGSAGDNMYVAIEDTAGNVAVYLNPDPNAQQLTDWTTWYTLLRDINSLGAPGPVNLEAISGFAIGFGVRCNQYTYGGTGDGDGNVMFDNIRLYSSKCVPAEGPLSDLDEDCDVDINDLELFVDNWLWAAVPSQTVTIKDPNAPVLWYKFNETEGATAAINYGTAGTYDANVGGTVIWDPTGGRNGDACITLNTLVSQNSCVEVPPAAFGFMADANHYYNAGNGGNVSFSVWINADRSVGDIMNSSWAATFSVYDSTWAELAAFSTPIRWSDSRAWLSQVDSTGATISVYCPTLPDNYYGYKWNHWAAVKSEPNMMTVYCNGKVVNSAGLASANVAPFFKLPIQSFRIGMRGGQWANWGKWSGKMQDFKVYDYALDANEIAHEATDGTGIVAFTPLVSKSNINLDGLSPEDPAQIVNFNDLAIMGQEWMLYHDVKLLYP